VAWSLIVTLSSSDFSEASDVGRLERGDHSLTDLAGDSTSLHAGSDGI